MNNRKSILFVLPLIGLVLMACNLTNVSNVTLGRDRIHGSGNVTSEDRSIQDVERVILTGTGDLTILQGSEEALTIEAEDNILPVLTSDMNGRELELGVKRGTSINPTKPIHYTLKVKDLSRIAVSGSGNITVEQFQAKDLNVEITGSGNVNIGELKADSLKARTSGAGNFDIAGEVQMQDITITGAGNFNGDKLRSSRADVTISGSGEVQVWVEQDLTIRITGFGNVRYYGSPTVTQSISGSGSVKSLGNK